MLSYTDAAWIWNASMQFISSEAITLKIEIAWWSRAIHCDMQPPQKIPADYDYARTRTPTAAHSSWVHIYPPWMQIPQRATSLCSCLNTIYILSVFFKHSPSTPISLIVSHHIVVNTVRRKITSNHSDLSLIRASSNGCGGGEDAGGGESGSRGWACSLNAWALHTCSITSSVLLRFTNPTDGRAPLAMRHVRLCILQRRTNRAGSSATPVYRGACVLSKLCFAGAQNSAEIGLLELFHSLQIDVECPALRGTESRFLAQSWQHNFLQCHSLH